MVNIGLIKIKKFWLLLAVLSLQNEYLLTMEKAPSEKESALEQTIQFKFICANCKKAETSEKFKVCTACTIAHYCSLECQKADWIEHQKICVARPNDDTCAFCDKNKKGIKSYRFAVIVKHLDTVIVNAKKQIGLIIRIFVT